MWRESHSYQETRRCLATSERKLAAQATREHASAQGFLRRFGIPGVEACRPARFADPHQEPVASWEASEAVLVAQDPL